VKRRLVEILATAGYVGYIPVASGTFGTAVGWLCYLFLQKSVLLFASWIAVGAVGGAAICTLAEEIFQEKDSHKIVLDEVVGYWVTMFLLPSTAGYALAGFLLFRLFDVLKPLGIRRVQAWPGGWGVMVDDLLAGLLANLILQAFRLVCGA